MSDTNHKPHITVVGDLILDRYLIGDATKLNPEMPGVVIRVDKEDDRLGGAAAVAMLAASFGVKVTLAGVVGDDEPGNRLRQLLDAHGIESHVWVDHRPTTWKQRIVARGQLRPDRCDREVTTPVSDRAEQFLAEVPLGDILLVSDYGKGVCAQDLLNSLGRRAREARISNLIDPARSRNWSDYTGATIIKANLTEAAEAWGTDSIPPDTLAANLSRKFACHAVITLGGLGMICAELDVPPWHLPAERVEVRDVCGAGDTVFATLGVSLACGCTLPKACRLANAAAGRQVGTIGIAPSSSPSECFSPGPLLNREVA